MTAEKRRMLRMACKALLLVSLPLAGFAWALPEDATMMVLAGLLTVVSVGLGFGAEFLASSAENDLHELTDSLEAEHQRRAAVLEERDEKLRQFDRVVALLNEQNHALRAKLVTVQVDLQRKKEALLQAAGDAVTLEDLPQAMRSAYVGRAS